MSLSERERKAAQRQRDREAGRKSRTINLSATSEAHLKALASAYGVTQEEVIARALAAAYAELGEEHIIEQLKSTDEMKPVEVARFLLDACSGDRKRAGKLYLEYQQRKHPGFKMSKKNPEHRTVESRYRGVVNQIRQQQWPIEEKRD